MSHDPPDSLGDAETWGGCDGPAAGTRWGQTRPRRQWL